MLYYQCTNYLPFEEDQRINGPGIGANKELYEEYRMKYFSKLLNLDQGFHIIQILVVWMF